MNFAYIAKSMFGTFQDDPAEPQDLLVVSPGLGRTGTSSFLTALNRIGIKSYHFTAALNTPGHLKKWVDYIQGDLSADSIIDMLSTDGFNATASMPACFLYKQLMQKYPNARVVLTVRGDGDGMAWANSIMGSVALFRKSIERIPFRWIPKVQQYKMLFDWMFAQGNVAVDKNNKEFNAEDLAIMYNEWVAEVKANVPSDNLLVFAAQDGWKPLCQFLSPLSEQVKSNCDDIIESGEAYPRINEKAQVARIVRILNIISTMFQYGPFGLALMAVWWTRKRSRGDREKTKQA